MSIELDPRCKRCVWNENNICRFPYPCGAEGDGYLSKSKLKKWLDRIEDKEG